MASETTAPSKSDSTPKLFTRAEVEKRSEGKETLLIIHNNVYNVTEFLNEHPGGEEVLLEQSGKDATEPFEDVGHSTDARSMMESYKIGEIIDAEKISEDTRKKSDLSNKVNNDDDSSSSWRSWLIPIALGVLATLVYRYFINAH